MYDTVKQVKFSNWKEGPQEYWRDVSSIARFIGSNLNYQVPRCNGMGLSGSGMVSTIRVDQHKEKFGEVRVYCALAAPELIEETYKARILKVDEERAKGFKSTLVTPEVYAGYRLAADAEHYRRTYMSMIDLVPHYRDIIRSCADYSELLCYDVAEFDASLELWGRENIMRRYGRMHADTFEALRDNLIKICGFEDVPSATSV